MPRPRPGKRRVLDSARKIGRMSLGNDFFNSVLIKEVLLSEKIYWLYSPNQESSLNPEMQLKLSSAQTNMFLVARKLAITIRH